MKQLKESILGSTRSGAAKIIGDVIEKYYETGFKKQPAKLGVDFKIDGNKIQLIHDLSMSQSALPDPKELKLLQSCEFISPESGYTELELWGIEINDKILKNIAPSDKANISLFECKITKNSFIPKCKLRIEDCIVDFDALRNVEGIFIDKQTFFLSNWDKLKKLKFIFDLNSHYGFGSADNIDRAYYERIYNMLK